MNGQTDALSTPLKQCIISSLLGFRYISMVGCDLNSGSTAARQTRKLAG